MKDKSEVFTRLFRYLLREDLYYVAYKNLYANNGAATKGINNDTADGFSEEKVKNIIKSLASESYMPNPVKRTYRSKQNGKMRPLGIPTFTDKLVQEVLRMVLESVYEPVFLKYSHGFRPGKSCHTALESSTREFAGIRWFIEGDIKGCFDNIEHATLINIIGNKIKDARIIKLLWKFLKAGYMENWQYHKTYSGCPQGGIISPLLANIYLHELDKHVAEIAEKFNKPRESRYTESYKRIRNKAGSIKRKLCVAKDSEERKKLAQELRVVRVEMMKTPSKLQTDKKIKYVRYADDFIIGVNGSKEDCVEIKSQLTKFTADNLKMELSEEKTLITHSNKSARFLGYDFRVRRNDAVRKHGKWTQRTLNNSVELNVPLEDKIMKFLFDNKTVEQKQNGDTKAVTRKTLLRCTDLEIVSAYNAELRGICNYYSLASNFSRLNYFSYLMEYSCLHTLAAKHKCSIGKIKNKFRDGKGNWGIPYETKKGRKRCLFADYSKCKDSKIADDKIANTTVHHAYAFNKFENRLKAKICELCGTTEATHYEIHHVHKVKDLKGKELWEQVMIAKRRKTMVLCRDCHINIHR
jgi:group II intron reverse transcriptase/maturase